MGVGRANIEQDGSSNEFLNRVYHHLQGWILQLWGKAALWTPLWSKILFGREIGWLIHLQISSSPDCRRNRRKWELRLCLVWREKKFTSEINSWCLKQVGVGSIAVSPFTGLSWSEMGSSVDKNSDWVQRGMGTYMCTAPISASPSSPCLHLLLVTPDVSALS